MVTLQSSKLFRHLPAAELDAVLAAAQDRRFGPGVEIFKEGDPGDGIYIVKTGGVEISAPMPGDRPHTISRLAPGDFFGEMAVLDQQPRSASAISAVESEVYFVPCEPILDLLTRSPKLSLTLLQEISRRIREFNQQYVRELLQAERMALIGRFASSIVHDLKNPLTIIGLAAEMACLGDSTSETRHTAQRRISRQIERITGMVNEILEFTRGASAQTTLTLADFAEFIRPVIEELQLDVSRKSVLIICENQPPSLQLRLNPPRLTRVFSNLVLNAVDEMPEGGQIKVRFDVKDGELVIELADSGKGIAPEISATLFQPFATHGKSKGTGLGLSISRRIIEEHGGKIWARNGVEGGAIFAFTLPLLKETQET